jgi:hypothetical protein
MSTSRLSRRTLLRGLGGIGIALPALEAMLPRGASAQAAPVIPNRFVLSYAGIPGSAEGSGPLMVPTKVGAAYDLPRALAPIGTLNMQSDVSIVTGLKVPWDTGSGVPAGGRSIYYHFNTLGPQVSGKRGPSSRNGAPAGITADQIVANSNAGSTPFKCLALRVQAVDYDSNTATTGDDMSMSWKGAGQRVDPIFSPTSAFQSLFSNFTPTDPASVRAAQAALAQRKSVLDLVDWNSQRVLPTLGSADQLRLQAHFDAIRDLEMRIASMPVPMGACVKPATPPSDPSIGSGYSNEEQRAQTMAGILAMALACDLTRSATFQLTQWKCYMGMSGIDGKNTDMHSMTHAPDANGVSDAIAWHVKQFTRLAAALKAIPEVDGTTVLDHTAMVMCMEGGNGYDPEGGANNMPHSTENMSCLMAGRAGGLKPGKHVVATGKHPANVVISAMNAVGVSGGLGEVSGQVADLFV